MLAAVGQHLPRGQLSAIASILSQRLLLRWRGWGNPLHDGQRPLSGPLQRLDVLWSVSSGLGFVSPIDGQVLQMRYSRHALASGEPRYLGYAFCLELCYLAMGGQAQRSRLEELRRRALALGERTSDKDLSGVAMASGGLASFLMGRWREAAERFRDAEVVLRDQCTRVRWQRDMLETFLVGSLQRSPTEDPRLEDACRGSSGSPMLGQTTRRCDDPLSPSRTPAPTTAPRSQRTASSRA